MNLAPLSASSSPNLPIEDSKIASSHAKQRIGLIEKWCSKFLLLIDRIQMIFKRLVSNDKIQKAANQYKVGYYNGDVFVSAASASDADKNPLLYSIRQILKGVDQQNMPSRTFVAIQDPDSELVLDVPREAHRDMHRLGSLSLNDQKIYEPSTKSNWKPSQFYKQLIEKFGRNGFINLTSLTPQENMADCGLHVCFKTGRSKDEGGVGAGGRGLKYHVDIEDRSAFIEVTFSLERRLTSPDTAENLGYIALQRKISISRQDLQRDWSNIALEKIAPSLKIVDIYSRHACTLQEAQQDLELSIKAFSD